MKSIPVCLFALTVAACGERPDQTAGVAPAAQSPAAAPPSPAAGAPPVSAAANSIPPEFQHVWAIEAGDCTNEPALTRIAIAPNAVKFYEGRSEVVSAEAPHEGALTLEVAHTSEGTTAPETHVLALDEAGATLTYKRRGAEFTYTRCD